RNVRLDFFRGLSLFIILVSHTGGDVLSDWIPARFGLSDAANMFVFVSGYAGGMAFGGVYRRRGWAMGTARIGLRLWQLYVAQLCIVMAAAALAVAADGMLGSEDHQALFGLDYLFQNPQDAILRVVTLTYVPHYLDILPVYIMVLAMVPIAVALARIHPLLVPAASLTLWGLANLFGWNLPTEPGEPRGWYFDPFCWQILFFTGFSLSMKWIRPPPANRILFWAAVAWLGFGVAVTQKAIFTTVPGLDAVQAWIVANADKTMVDPLQYLHFIASAYVVVVLLKGHEEVLHRPVFRPIVKCGQQALSVFLSGILLADLGGLAFDVLGDGWVQQIAVNAACFAATIAIAYTVAWMKSAPWARPVPHPVPAPAPEREAARVSR
ncbi:MAG TPA: OpgC domain-containing protein, partial [Stellaceae bacterium]|nr:OpgC domain-containing protein [Stellaceae bacterium]